MNEFELIQRYFVEPLAKPSPAVVAGPGDDCAVLRIPPGQEMCISTDTLLEGRHFLAGSRPSVVAARAIGANISDLAAMGASPIYGSASAILTRLIEQH